MLRKEPHPLAPAVYEELGDGRVRVVNTKTGKEGIFLSDGTWLEGEITHADPHLLGYVGGINLPPGKDVYWAMITPPVDGATAADAGSAYAGGRLDASAAEPKRVTGKYVPDPGRMTEEGMRSSSYLEPEFLLANDRYPDRIPEVYHLKSPYPGGPKRVPTDRYYEKRYHDLEVEHIWKKTWQFVCREDDIPEIGDYQVYDIAHLSFLVVRTGENEFKAHQNICLHRGRQLRECDGKKATEFRCPYHGWSWNLDGSMKEMTCEWDFPDVRDDVDTLRPAQVATWAGFVFINPDPDAGPLEEYLGPVMMAHYEKFRYEGRWKQAHVARVMDANWKVVMEAFKEAYHVIATHPQLMLAGGDAADSRYDIFDNWSRAGHLTAGSASPQRGIYQSKEEILQSFQGAADMNREYLRGILGDEVDIYSDAEMNDTSFNDLFPNLHPWGGWARIVFQFRPYGDDPNKCMMDVILLAPWPKDKPKPPATPRKLLRPDQSWCEAPELGSLARIVEQDCFNVPKVQDGLKSGQLKHVWYSKYQESKIRHFHDLYEKYLGLDD